MPVDIVYSFTTWYIMDAVPNRLPLILNTLLNG